MAGTRNALNFLICIDKNFILGAGALIASIFDRNPDAEMKFHIFTPAASQEEIKSKLLPRLAKRFDCANKFVFYANEDTELFKKIHGKVNDRILVQLMRIASVRACKVTNSSTLIYLDADIICDGDLTPLANLNFENNVIAVTKGEGPKDILTLTGDKFHVKDYYYAGVLIFNLDIWNQSNLDEQLVDWFIRYRPTLQDQDAFNVLCEDKALIIDEKYQSWPPQAGYIRGQAPIIHFAGGKPWAPWHFKAYRYSVNLFRHYCKMFEPDVTQWISFKQDKDTLVNFNSFHARKAMKWLSKLFYRRGNFKAFIYFYWRHLQIKIQQKGIIGVLLMKSNTRS